MPTYLFTRKSSNAKTGKIPVTSSPKQTCPSTCPLKAGGCYALGSFMGNLWSDISSSKAGHDVKSGVAVVKSVTWAQLCKSVSELPDGQLWRHNQMGDLPKGRTGISTRKLDQLVRANKGKKGFTYTHHNPKDPALGEATKDGFTINLSANNPSHADELLQLDNGPVVTVLPSDMMFEKFTTTPAGRPITVCPAVNNDNITCKTCGLCQIANRPTIIGFPAHGMGRKKAELV